MKCFFSLIWLWDYYNLRKLFLKFIGVECRVSGSDHGENRHGNAKSKKSYVLP